MAGPTKPRGLTKAGAAEWRRLLAHQAELKVLVRPGDRTAMLRHVTAFELYSARMAQLCKLEQGGPPPAPTAGAEAADLEAFAAAMGMWLSGIERLEKQAERWARELERTTKLLGLAPSHRTVSRDNNVSAATKAEQREQGAVDGLRRRAKKLHAVGS